MKSRLTSFNPALILFDIDDTLIVDDNLIYKNATVIKKIHRIQRSGIQIGISTSRSYEMAWPVYKFLNLDGPILVEMGANYAFKSYKLVKRVFMLVLLWVVKDLIVVSALTRGITINVSNKRKYSLSISVKDIAYINNLVKTVNNIVKITPCLASSYRYGDNRIYVRYANIKKNSAVEELLHAYSDIYVIGDFEHNVPSQSIHYLGVFNSENDYKTICEYHTNKYEAEGIIDLLSYAHNKAKYE